MSKLKDVRGLLHIAWMNLEDAKFLFEEANKAYELEANKTVAPITKDEELNK